MKPKKKRVVWTERSKLERAILLLKEIACDLDYQIKDIERFVNEHKREP